MKSLRSNGSQRKITIEDCHNNMPRRRALHGVLFRALEVGAEAIGEHNLSILGGNWEGIIGDRLSRPA